MFHSILGFDIEDYSRDTEAVRLAEKRSQLELIISQAAKKSDSRGIRKLNKCTKDTGDGVFVFLETRDFKAILQFLCELRIIAKKLGGIRLRGVLHQGDCEVTKNLFDGKTIEGGNTIGQGFNEAARLLDSGPLRDLLKKEESENFVFGISREVYNEIHAQTFFDVSKYFECSVIVKKYNSSIYLFCENPQIEIINMVSIRSNLQLKPDFFAFLNHSTIGEVYAGASQDLSDTYVYPDLEKDFEAKMGSESIKSERYFGEYCIHPKNVILSGDEQIGKTSLCKMVYKMVLENGNQMPVYLSLKEDYSGKIDNKITHAIRSQYEGKNENWVSNKKVIIIDDFHLVSARYQRKILDEVFLIRNVFCILVVDSVYNVNFLEREVEQVFESFTIKEYGPSLRNEIIEMWMEASRIEDENYKIIDGLKDYVDNTLLRGIVPSTPINILVILEERRAFNPLRSEITSKGHCYQTLIYIALKRAEIADEEYDIYLNYLENLAYFMYKNKIEGMSEKDYIANLADYGEEYNQPIPSDLFVRKIGQSKIICKSSLDEYRFNCKYIYFFFLAKHLADHKDTEQVSHAISEIYNNLQINDNGYIGVFIIHHLKDEKILEEIELNLLVQYEKYKEAEMSKSEVDFLSSYVQSFGRLSITARNSSYENRKQQLHIEDKSEKETLEQNAETSEFNVNTELNDIRKALRIVEVMGQILKTRTGSFRKDTQKRYFREAIEVYLRLTGRFIVDFRENEKEFIEYFKDRIAKFNKEKLSTEEVYKLAISYYYNFNLLNYFACVNRATKMLCSEQILQVVSEVCDEIGTQLTHFVKINCEMWFKKQVPIDEIRKDMKDMNDFPKSLLSVLMIRFCELHNISIQDKQKIASALKIKVNELIGGKQDISGA